MMFGVNVTRQYRCLSGISNNALSSKELPVRLKVLNWGDNPSQKGPVAVNAETVAALSAQIAGKAFERIVIDFEHNSETTHANYQKPPRSHAGYGTLQVIPGDGVYLEAIEWTPSGRQYARDYSDLSPVVNLSKQDGKTVIAMKSVALCPNGALEDVTFFSADESVLKKETDMEELKVLQATVEDQKAKIVALTATLDGQKSELGKVAALAGDVVALKADLSVIRADNVTRARAAIVDRAAREGKVIPLSAEDIGKMEPATLSAMVDKLTVTVPLTARTPSVTPPSTSEQDAQKKAEKRASAIRTRAGEIMRAENVSFSAAFQRAETEILN